MNKLLNHWKLDLVLCLTLSAAALTATHSQPFYPLALPTFQTAVGQTTRLNPVVYNTAYKAYTCARQQGLDQQGILTLIDYSLPSSVKRLWVIDMPHHKILFHTLVAHGRSSGEDLPDPTLFSNHFDSHQSSVGLFRTGGVYSGRNGLSMKLIGLEPGFNDHAEARHIVMHSAWYVSQNFIEQHGRLGRTWGCPALNGHKLRPVIQAIKNGSLVFIYAPIPNWLKHSSFLHCR